MKRRIIRSATTPVRAATDDAKEQVFKDKLDSVEEDFSFVLAGAEKLFRNGGEQADFANTLLSNLSESLQSCISDMAGQL